MRGKNTFLTAGGLFMGLIIVLGLIGIANGLWSKNLVVHGVVETGDLNADWDCGYVNDDGQEIVIQGGGCAAVVEPPGDNGADPTNFKWPDFVRNIDPKDVGDCELRIGDEDETGFGDQVAYVELHNTYPSYECTVTLYLTNTGSVPFNVIGARLTSETAAQGNIETVDDDGINRCDPTVNETVQVDPGNELRFDCTIHVTQSAEQSVGCTATTDTGGNFPVITPANDCTTLVDYEFAINVCVAQWNEVTTYENCKNPDPGTHEGPDEVTFP